MKSKVLRYHDSARKQTAPRLVRGPFNTVLMVLEEPIPPDGRSKCLVLIPSKDGQIPQNNPFKQVGKIFSVNEALLLDFNGCVTLEN